MAIRLLGWYCMVVVVLTSQHALATNNSRAAQSTTAPSRVVSLNLCVDELVLALADEAQIASLTWLVKDPQLSSYAAIAQRFHSNKGHAEEVIRLQPDMVLAASYTAPATLEMLRKFDIPVTTLVPATSVRELIEQLTELGRLLGQPARAANLVAELEAAIDARTNKDLANKVTAAVFQPNGLTVTAGTFANDVLRLSGIVNLAVEKGLPNYARLPLEQLVHDQPDLLVVSNYDNSMPSLAQEILAHPVLRQGFAPEKIVRIPAQTWTCPSPQVLRALEILRRASRTGST